MKWVDRKILQRLNREFSDPDHRSKIIADEQVRAPFSHVFEEQDHTIYTQIADELRKITAQGLPHHTWTVKSRSIVLVGIPPDDSFLSIEQEDRLVTFLKRQGVAGENERQKRAESKTSPRFRYSRAEGSDDTKSFFKISMRDGLQGGIADLDWLRSCSHDLSLKFNRIMTSPSSKPIVLSSAHKDKSKVNFPETGFLDEVLIHFENFSKLHQDTYEAHRDENEIRFVKKGKTAFTFMPQKCQIHAVDDDEVIAHSIALFIRTSGVHLIVTDSTPEFDQKLVQALSDLIAQGELHDNLGQSVRSIQEITINGEPISEAIIPQRMSRTPPSPAP